MVEINWHNFKAKFNGKETVVFEQLAYLLFCAEHQIKIGLFRFKNQTGIETEPIELEGRTVGFQAKYYGTNLSENKNDMISSLQKAKRENDSLTHILFYVNQEFSESSKSQTKKPQYQVDIEDEAEKLGIELAWRVPSHFEIQLSQPENHHIAEYFFQLHKNLVDFLSELQEHAKNILSPIRSELSYQSAKIKIDRSEIIGKMENSPGPVTIITGEGGSGKTALIKDFFTNTSLPVYVFKAAEFNITHISELFSRFGSYSLLDFITAHKEEENKIIVVDSAERLADLENQDAFKEFLTALLNNGWHLFFTTRHGYYNDLTFQLLEIYQMNFKVLRIDNVSLDELESLARLYNFELPENQKLKQLICNLFYLDEYLRASQDIAQGSDVSSFRNILWQKKILNSVYKKDNTHISREQCFIALVNARAETGHFYIEGNQCDQRILSLLASEEIIQYDENQRGYFITHDIYEEWALDKIIVWEFRAKESLSGFFNKIGTSLIIRRAFRHWLSENLSTDPSSIQPFIEAAFTAAEVDTFWKDELLVSTLLSPYAGDFFVGFESILLANSAAYLKRIIFLLRIACKEVDRLWYSEQALQEKVSFDAAYLITKPKGEGWYHCIKFVHDHRDKLAVADLPLYFALFDEWTTHYKSGGTTKFAAATALHFYEANQKDGSILRGDDTEERVLSIILAGTGELKEEFDKIVETLLKGEIYHHRSPYDDILEAVLKPDHIAVPFIRARPQDTLKLAEKYWYLPTEERHEMDYGGIGTAQYYNIPSRWDHEYSPASAYHTPIFYCLEAAFADTIKFILRYTNRIIDAYAKSGFDDGLFEIDIVIDQETTVKQYINISGAIWNMFRGSGSPVTPYMVQSYHMALEKYLLEISRFADANGVARWLIYLLKNSRSASITAIVASVVNAWPDKFFNVAAVLFGCYELMQYDNYRLAREHEAKSIYGIGMGFNSASKIYEDERWATVEQPHRKMTLESLALNYQFFRNPRVTDAEADDRLATINRIVDIHYDRIAALSSDADERQAYRLLVARIDRRKMNPSVEQTDDNFIVNFNPELDEELTKVSEAAQQSGSDLHKFSKLKLWGTKKFSPNSDLSDYPEFDNDPQLVVSQLRELITELNNDPTDSFILFNRSNVPYACYGLLKDHIDALSEEDLKLCCDLVFSFAKLPLENHYDYQIADGVEVSVRALPYLYAKFPDRHLDFDAVLFLLLFDLHSIGEYKRVCDYSIEAILTTLVGEQPEVAKRILNGYKLFAQIFNDHQSKYVIDIRKAGKAYLRADMIDAFTNDHNEELGSWISGNLEPGPIDVENTDIAILETLLQLVPFDTDEVIYLSFAKAALPRLAIDLLKEDPRERRLERRDYKIRLRFNKKAAYFLLKRNPSDIAEWVQPFADAMRISEESERFLQELIGAEDILQTYEPFWLAWACFYDKIKEYSKLRSALYLNPLIHTYLLAWPWWKKTAKQWFSLKEREKQFFIRCSKDMGSHPATLYGLAKIFNEVASGFANEGMIWISDLLTANKNLFEEQPEVNTVYYLEIMARKYVYLNRTKLKTDRFARSKLLVVLEYLISRASVNAYLLREEII